MVSNRYIITCQAIKQNKCLLVIEYPYVNFRKQRISQKTDLPDPSDDAAELHVLARPACRYDNARKRSGCNVRSIARVTGRVRIQYVLHCPRIRMLDVCRAVLGQRRQGKHREDLRLFNEAAHPYPRSLLRMRDDHAGSRNDDIYKRPYSYRKRYPLSPHSLFFIHLHGTFDSL